MKKTALLGGLLAATCLAGTASADKLDDIMASGTLRCAVVLDFPPMGSRDADNNAIGFDVDYCNDLAKALGVEAKIVETPFPDRIPALVSGRVDVGVASTSDTLERAKTAGFSVPYFAFTNVVLTREDAGVEGFDDLKGKTVGSVGGTYEGIQLEDNIKEWGDGDYRPYQSQADVFLALSQGQIDGTVVTSTVASSIVQSGKYDGLVIKGDAPYLPDYVALIALRQEYGLLNYLDLFINQQVRTGRYQELFDKWVGGDAPDLTVSKVYR
ncbi:transporter substrate-binding domain-containing protein (plasmid) [Pseudorhodobacter turbinis]|uniref:Transporter substrate-binding domain-containing protein n=1 Tax=Pseudorhodobacter turbinis TaxID=2500533 RepID=A0A4P8EKD7_9RHOB|nr:transporter substrate-binding domain-containing protein [Pseudorhodobacter turbinis]QCO57488.1 transporter substrate-binding domain-containing protein [Pseudorhodobacter turbinis]